jgi:hypothetical protein
MAGLVDLGLSGVERALREVRSVLRRSDLRALTREGRADLRARGEVALRRYMPVPESRMEYLARTAFERQKPAEPDSGA